MARRARWYPNDRQWWAIWLSAVPALLLWISADPSRETEHLAISVAVVGALVVWRLATPMRPWEQDESTANLARMSNQIEGLQDTLDKLHEQMRERDLSRIEIETGNIRVELIEMQQLLIEIRDVLHDTRTDARVARLSSSSSDGTET